MGFLNNKKIIGALCFVLPFVTDYLESIQEKEYIRETIKEELMVINKEDK